MTKEYKNELLKEIQDILQESESTYKNFDLKETYNGIVVVIDYDFTSFETQKNEKVKVFKSLEINLSMKNIKSYYKTIFKNETSTQQKETINYEMLTIALKLIDWWYN